MGQHKKNLQYYKDNAEEYYKSVPISVLAYISKLEEILGSKKGDESEKDKLICPFCNSENTDVIHSLSNCECSDCGEEFES